MTRQSNVINIDLDKYVLYVYRPTDEPVVVLKTDAGRFHQLSSDWDGLENVPETEKVMVSYLVFDKIKNAYVVHGNNFVEQQINELDTTWLAY